jgi:hypothetical protein
MFIRDYDNSFLMNGSTVFECCQYADGIQVRRGLSGYRMLGRADGVYGSPRHQCTSKQAGSITQVRI